MCGICLGIHRCPMAMTICNTIIPIQLIPDMAFFDSTLVILIISERLMY